MRRRPWQGIRLEGRNPASPSKAEVGGLDKALAAVNAAAAQGRVMWLSLLAFGTYLFIVVGGTTHRDLLLEGPVKLPILATELPLFTFYWAAPVLFILFHLYMLLKLGVIGSKLALFEAGLKPTLAGIGDEGKRAAAEAGWRGQLDAFLYLQMRAAPTGSAVQRALIRATVWFTVVIGPVLLLLAFQIRFLPYHHEVMTWAHRAAVAVDLALLLLLWPAVAGGRRAGRWLPIAAFGAVTLPLSLLIATIPGETAQWGLQQEDAPPWHLTHVLFEGEWDETKRKVASPFTRNLALRGEVLVDRDRLDNIGPSLDLQGRDLRFADFWGADLRRASLKHAQLKGAQFYIARLEDAQLVDAQMQGVNLAGARLQNANLLSAHLQGANLNWAFLQGADLFGAQLQGASLWMASLQGADLAEAQLQGANLREAELQGASLIFAQLQGASLYKAELQGADLKWAQLQGADLRGSSVWRSEMKGAALTLADLRDLKLAPMAPGAVEALRTKVSDMIAAVQNRDFVLKKLAVLSEAWDEQREAAAREAWLKAASAQRPETEYEPALAAFLTQLACDPAGAPFVARGIAARVTVIAVRPGLPVPLLSTFVDEPTRPHSPVVAKALLDPGCAGAHGLTDDERATLQRIVGEAAAKP